MQIREPETRFWAGAGLIGGTLFLFGLLAFVPIPAGNRDMMMGLSGAWSLGLGLMLKRLFEGSTPAQPPHKDPPQ